MEDKKIIEEHENNNVGYCDNVFPGADDTSAGISWVRKKYSTEVAFRTSSKLRRTSCNVQPGVEYLRMCLNGPKHNLNNMPQLICEHEILICGTKTYQD